MRMYLFEAIVVFAAGYVLGKHAQKDKNEVEIKNPLDPKNVNAELKDGKIVIGFGG